MFCHCRGVFSGLFGQAKSSGLVPHLLLGNWGSASVRRPEDTSLKFVENLRYDGIYLFEQTIMSRKDLKGQQLQRSATGLSRGLRRCPHWSLEQLSCCVLWRFRESTEAWMLKRGEPVERDQVKVLYSSQKLELVPTVFQFLILQFTVVKFGSFVNLPICIFSNVSQNFVQLSKM